MTKLPDMCRETATYGRYNFYFQLPEEVHLPDLVADRHNYEAILANASLPNSLGEFLTAALSSESIRSFSLGGTRIILESTYNVPGFIGRARTNQRIQILWACFMRFFGNEDANDEAYWNSLPVVYLERGEGRDLREAGLHMARLMDYICGVAPQAPTA